MAARRKIGLIYEYNENWIGGTYYIQNLISALKLNLDKDIPAIYVYTKETKHYEQLKLHTQYPYMYRGGFNFLANFLKKEQMEFLQKKLFVRRPFRYLNRKLDYVFPAEKEENFHPKQAFIYWIPDFQEHYLPEFFSEEILESRKRYQRAILGRAKNIIFSSKATQEDFNTIYPGSHVKQFVLPFAVSHPPLNTRINCLEKYNITYPYFICCNQFWKHKNHIVVLEAIKILKEKGEKVKVLFTGKDHDFRNPDYFAEIKNKVQSFSIEGNVSFLGFIDREDQLSLIKTSLAVIQPSLFEGWSTVIEDAKSLSVSIIASDLKVHKEQLINFPKSHFFGARVSLDLATKMNLIIENPKDDLQYNYSPSIVKFGKCFMDIVNAK